jgi:DNA-directed RNA polymerase subunit RPC12/RpoP
MTETHDEQQDSDKKPDAPDQSFKCANCAAKMQYKPGAEAQKCPYCGHENPIPTSEEDIQELDFHAFLAQQANEEETEEHLTITCQDCAAETTADPNVVSSDCPFCGSHIVSTANSTKGIKPRSLLPFKITRHAARDSFQKWMAGLWFAPNCLKEIARQDSKLAGLYVPYWTYDSDTTSFYRGQRGKHYWETQHYTTQENGKTVHKTRRVRKTRWYPASGTVWGHFDDVLVLASTSLPKKYTEKLEPWDLPSLVPYKDEYLSGFKAESYQVDLADGFQQAQKIMETEIRSMVRRDIGGDEQRIHSIKTQHSQVTFKHILLPIWISAYRFKDQAYRFLVNARTGEVQGERPWSWIKITLLVLSILAAVGVAILIQQASQG